jgi:S-adenosylmethionine-diacylgycerolhomoserine-N-methlytransferase
MDRIYRRQRHFYDVTRKYFLLGRDRLIRDLAPPPGSAILEVGCGTGRNLIAAARRYPDATLYGLDVSTAMLSTARAAIRRAGLEDRITLARGDAAEFDARPLFGRSAFDRVFFSYSLSMIPPWRKALRIAYSLAADTCQIHIVDFGRQERLPSWVRPTLTRWLQRFEVTQRHDLQSALAQLAGPRDRVLFETLFRGYAWYGRIERGAG